MIDYGQCVFSLLPQKKNCLKKISEGGNPPFLKTSRWPILPHLGGVKWVTYLLMNNINHYLIPSEELKCISEKQVT